MILVTGAGGNIGRKLSGLLSAAGVEHRAAYHTRAGSPGSTTMEMSDLDSVLAALDGVTTVFLLGATGPGQTERELNVVDAAVTAGVRRIVKVSVWRADEELTPIARLHRPVERALAESSLSWTSLRPNFFMQTFTTAWARAIAATNTFAGPVIRGPISFTDTDDIAAVAFRVLVDDGHDGKTYALTGPRALTYEDAAAVLSAELGRTIRYQGLSDEQTRELLPPFQAGLLIGVAAAYRERGADTVTTAVEELTGREPTSFQQFVRDHRHVWA